MLLSVKNIKEEYQAPRPVRSAFNFRRHRGNNMGAPPGAAMRLPTAPRREGIRMARRPFKPCAYPGCSELVSEGRYCPKHQHKEKEQMAERHRYYDTHQRDERADRFYKSKAWVATRQAVLTRDLWLCQDCKAQGRLTPANHVHHIVELRDDWSKRLHMDNLISLCASCHSQRHTGHYEGVGGGQ
jgi:5-methylcytosine-specific restriction protein A